MNRVVPQGEPPQLTIESPSIRSLEARLRDSLTLRICNVPEPPGHKAGGSKLAVLFSGGLDCALLARLSHEILPSTEPIDLLNVAFENPRVAAAAATNKSESPTSLYENCPDRITGRKAFTELCTICPARTWRFVAIDIPYAETLAHRNRIIRLMRPHNTEMDLSIACALYFASRGHGLASDPSAQTPTPYIYTTPARVLLSGLGADELFAGYSRHGAAYSRAGFEGLIEEIDLDVSRLGKRNLGRDDRVLCAWAREARYPYLDEDVMAHVLRMPVWEKCGFGLPEPEPRPLGTQTPGEREREDGIDPEKRALRLLALRLGLEGVCRNKKRAIQFGARTAKMERGKTRTRGTDEIVDFPSA